MRSTIRLVVLTVFIGSSLAGCYNTRTLRFRQPPAPMEDNVTAAILYDGERVPLGNTDVELLDGELVVRDRSGTVVRRIAADEIQEVVVAEFSLGRTALAALGAYVAIVIVALAASDGAPE